MKRDVLRIIGMDMSLSGYSYWQDAIKLFKKDQSTKIDVYKITLIYSKLAKKYDTTAASVERSMRYARMRINNLQKKMNVDYQIRNSNFLAWLVLEGDNYAKRLGR